jgi:hypothetical protein
MKHFETSFMSRKIHGADHATMGTDQNLYDIHILGTSINPSDFEAHKGSRVLTNANSHVYIIYIYIYIYIYMCFVHGDRKLIN